jgi:arylformamidase
MADVPAAFTALPSLYRGMSRQALDIAYNNAVAVRDSAAFLSRWDRESEATRSRIVVSRAIRVDLDQRYTAADRSLVDLFLQSRLQAPTLIFIHGGYWQLNSKERFSFVAEGPLSTGMNVAILGYTLAPQASMDQIVGEIRQGVRWVADHLNVLGYLGPVGVAGWSAGGHLAALAMSESRVRFGLAISGIFDLEPIRLNYLNEKLGMSAQESQRNSPIFNIPSHAGYLTIAVGEDELPELRRQSADYFAAWNAAGLPGRHVLVNGRHHFAVLDELARPNGVLLQSLKSEIIRADRVG